MKLARASQISTGTRKNDQYCNPDNRFKFARTFKVNTKQRKGRVEPSSIERAQFVALLFWHAIDCKCTPVWPITTGCSRFWSFARTIIVHLSYHQKHVADRVRAGAQVRFCTEQKRNILYIPCTWYTRYRSTLYQVLFNFFFFTPFIEDLLRLRVRIH